MSNFSFTTYDEALSQLHNVTDQDSAMEFFDRTDHLHTTSVSDVLVLFARLTEHCSELGIEQPFPEDVDTEEVLDEDF